MFENKVLRKIFRLREMKLQKNEECYTMLGYMYCIIRLTIRNLKSRRLRWAGHVAHIGKSRNAYGVLVEKPQEKRHLGRPRHR